MKWFRFYNEALLDPKVQRLPPHLFKAWVNFLCFASRNGGVLPSVEDMAFDLRQPVAKVSRDLSDLVARALLDARDGVRPHNWESRQFVSDHSNQRVKAHRDRYKDVTCNDIVTPPDTDTEDRLQKQKEIPAAKSGSNVIPLEFEILWQKFPHRPRDPRQPALKSWKRLTVDEQQRALAACERLDHLRNASDRQYIPMLSTWLNQKRFDDTEPPRQQNWMV
jgi:hypothetical protein